MPQHFARESIRVNQGIPKNHIFPFLIPQLTCAGNISLYHPAWWNPHQVCHWNADVLTTHSNPHDLVATYLLNHEYLMRKTLNFSFSWSNLSFHQKISFTSMISRQGSGLNLQCLRTKIRTRPLWLLDTHPIHPIYPSLNHNLPPTGFLLEGQNSGISKASQQQRTGHCALMTFNNRAISWLQHCCRQLLNTDLSGTSPLFCHW